MVIQNVVERPQLTTSALKKASKWWISWLINFFEVHHFVGGKFKHGMSAGVMGYYTKGRKNI